MNVQYDLSDLEILHIDVVKLADKIKQYSDVCIAAGSVPWNIWHKIADLQYTFKGIKLVKNTLDVIMTRGVKYETNLVLRFSVKDGIGSFLGCDYEDNFCNEWNPTGFTKAKMQKDTVTDYHCHKERKHEAWCARMSAYVTVLD